LRKAYVRGGYSGFWETDAQHDGSAFRLRSRCVAGGKQDGKTKNAAPVREPHAASDDTNGPKAVAAYFLVSTGESSIIHGQKFWGLRVLLAFLITVIFMIVPLSVR
jgi:hypothetical protein